MKPVSRWMVLVCTICMTGSLVFPFWKITLVAPQYPEGVQMVIYPHGVAGEVNIINGLNHYIGMRNIVNSDFPEFSFLPYWLGFLVVVGLIVFIVNKRKMLWIWFSLIVLTGLVGVIDFWKWEFDYGHHLDPHAAIKIPGMTYQPPLIGYKQLLNFLAGSFPATGAYLIIIPCMLLMGVLILEERSQKKLQYATVK